MSISAYDFWLTMITLLATGLTMVTGITLGFVISGYLWGIFWLRLQRKQERAQRNTKRVHRPAAIQTEDISPALPIRKTGTLSVMKEVRRGTALSIHGKRR